ncbi:MAG TPA: hypothetical protein VMS17_30800 [Gemmataceae bacterium]|nr:hypothetical protein [Gemmataceae bacterium]
MVGPQTATVASARPRPAALRALGRDDPPQEIEVDRALYHRVEIFKHDSWAATALYEGPAGRIVCKFNRRQPLFGLPLAWLGRLLARREAHILALLADLPNVPAPRGVVRVGGKRVENAVAHAYVAGRPLAQRDRVPDDFFPRLGRLLAEMHRRKMAYVDLHKAENILLGDDGQPYLIDFQISAVLGWRWPADTAILRGLLTLLQRSDEYHFRKHVRHNRPDIYAEMPISQKVGRPWWIRAHRMIAVPFRSLRRRLLAQLRVRDASGRAASEHFAEDAIRRQKTADKAA